MNEPGWYHSCVFLKVTCPFAQLSKRRPLRCDATGLILMNVSILIHKAGLESFGVLHLKMPHLIQGRARSAISDLYRLLQASAAPY